MAILKTEELGEARECLEHTAKAMRAVEKKLFSCVSGFTVEPRFYHNRHAIKAAAWEFHDAAERYHLIASLPQRGETLDNPTLKQRAYAFVLQHKPGLVAKLSIPYALPLYGMTKKTFVHSRIELEAVQPELEDFWRAILTADGFFADTVAEDCLDTVVSTYRHPPANSPGALAGATR